MGNFSLFEAFGLLNEKTVILGSILFIGIPFLTLKIVLGIFELLQERQYQKKKQSRFEQNEKERREQRESFAQMSQRLSEEQVEALCQNIPPFPLTIRSAEKVWLHQVILFLENCSNPMSQIPEPRGNPVWDGLRGQISKKYANFGLDQDLISQLSKESKEI